MKDLLREKMWAAERWIGWMRVAALGVASVHPAVFGFEAGSRGRVLPAFLALAWGYTIWLVLREPYRRSPFAASPWFGTIADGVFITCYLLLTGGAGSPWYPHYYIALALVAYRFGPAETLKGAALYAAFYLALTAGSYVLDGDAPLLDIAFRVIVMMLLASVVGPLAGETIAQTGARIAARDLAHRAEATTAQLRALLVDAGTGILVLDEKGRMEFANAEARRLLGPAVNEGADAEQLLGAFAYPLAPGRLTLSMRREVVALAEPGRFGRISSSRYGDGMGRVVVIEDATDEMRAAHELRAARFRAEEAERRRIAGELHDEVGEVLTGLHLALDRMAAGEGGASAEELLDRLMQRVQSLSVDLRPPVLDDLGLVPALVTLVDRFRAQSGVATQLTHSGMGKRLPPDAEIAAYRVVQEALTNIARHSGAHSASVRLELSGTHLSLEIEDDGRGLGQENRFGEPPKPYYGSGSGLTGMRERVTLLGGIVQVEAAAPPETGTRIRVQIPLQRAWRSGTW